MTSTEYANLDDDWINKFDKTDNLYKDFYKEDLYYVNLQFVYINKDNEIDKLRQESFLMSKPNYITRDEILGILKKNTIDNGTHYSLLSILRYNVTLEPEEIHFYLKNDGKSSYMSVIKNIDTILFEKSISMFHDLNDVIFLFYEKTREHSKNSVTKRVYLRPLSSRKKTLRNRLKDGP